MAKAILKLQDSGRAFIQKAATGLSSYSPNTFHVGDSAAFAATTTETEARGNLTFTGSSNLINYRILDPQTVRMVLTIPEGEGPFLVGNILLFAQGDDGASKPFASVVLPFQITKTAAGIDSGSVALPNPGSRLIVNITIVNQVLDPAEDPDITVEVVTPDYANLATFDNEMTLPSAALNPWKTSILSTSKLTGGPVLLTERAGVYWSMPFLRDVRHPNYNTLSGGVQGDSYRESPYTFIWGQRYITPDATFKAVIGGSNYTDTPETAGPIIGGQSY